MIETVADANSSIGSCAVPFVTLLRAVLTGFISDHETTVAVGTTITWTATATGTVYPLEYRFERRDDLGNWSIVQNYGMANTYTWTTTTTDVGTSAVRVSVRNGGSLADFEDTATLLVRVVEGEGEGFWLREPDVRVAWWKRWLRRPPSVPVSLGITHETIATSQSDARRYSLYSPVLQLLAETEISTAPSPAIEYEYVWFGGQPLAQITSATGAIDWYFNDHLGTPILQTDAEANLAWRVEYDPYGVVYQYRTAAEKHQPLRFPSQENDAQTELSYNIFRWYRAGWGRYTQSDLIGLEGGLNEYRYGAANPLTYVDPLGLKVCRCDRRLNSWPFVGSNWGTVVGPLHHSFVQIVPKGHPCGGLDGIAWGFQNIGGGKGRVEPEQSPSFNPRFRCKEVKCIDEGKLRQNIVADAKKSLSYKGVCWTGGGWNSQNCQGWADNVLDRSRKQSCCTSGGGGW